MSTNKVIKIELKQKVKVRKYPVPIKELQTVLREAKQLQKLTNVQIATALNISITKAEHWFRNDNCFAIPDSGIWLDLKRLLKINTDKFDQSIMTFEYRTGVYEKSERHYSIEGIAPTLTCDCGNTKIIIFNE